MIKMPTGILLTCPSGQLGGTEIRMIQEAEMLSGLGHRTTAITPRFQESPKLRALLKAKGIPYHTHNPPPVLNDWRYRHLHWLRSQLFERRAFTKFEPDLAHVFFPWTNQGLDQLWLCGRADIPTVISAHNAFPPVTFSPWHKGHFRTAFRSVRGVYGVSQVALDCFMANFGEFMENSVETRVIYNSVDLERFQPSQTERVRVRAKLGLPPSAPVLGSVGRLDKQKQPLKIVDVFEAVRETRPDARLVLIGEGHLQAETIEALKHRGLADATVMLPFQDDIETYFPAFDVHILMSRNEGFGIVTAEAMACGVPVVGTRVTGTEEVIAEAAAGRLVPKDDIQSAAGAVLELMEYKERDPDGLAQAARSHVERKFSRDIWLDRVHEFYSTILNAL